jgi:hypothetical protein
MNRSQVFISVLCAGILAAQSPPSPGTFTPTGSMTMPRVGHTATLLLNGKVLICGGSNLFSSLGTVWGSAELYDPPAGTFTATGKMTTPRKFHTATLLPDGKVLIVGGTADPNAIVNGSSVLGSAEIYDPVTSVFTAIADMKVPRMYHTATLLNNGKALISGGLGLTINNNNNLSDAELYDPLAGFFTPTGTLITPRVGHTAALLPDGTVLVAGGSGYDDGPIPSIERYDPATGAFSFAGATGSVQSSGPAIASVLTTGQVLMPLHLYDSPTAAARLYDYSTATFVDTGNMRAPRWATATLLPTRKVLIAGYAAGDGFPSPGSPAASGLPSADLYDPAQDGFSATADMATPRFNHTATLLPDGTVLMSGGMTSFYYPTSALASAEIYHPDVLVPAPVLLSLSGDGKGQGAIQHAGTYQLVSADNPAVAREIVVIYGTGLSDGSVIPPQVAIGGRMAEVLWFGNVPGYPGLNQINVRVPDGIGAGSPVPVRMNYIGRPSNTVTIEVK